MLPHVGLAVNSVVAAGVFAVTLFYFTQNTAQAVGGPGPDSYQLIVGFVMLLVHMLCYRALRSMLHHYQHSAKAGGVRAIPRSVTGMRRGMAGAITFMGVATWAVFIAMCFVGQSGLYLVPAITIIVYGPVFLHLAYIVGRIIHCEHELACDEHKRSHHRHHDDGGVVEEKKHHHHNGMHADGHHHHHHNNRSYPVAGGAPAADPYPPMADSASAEYVASRAVAHVYK